MTRGCGIAAFAFFSLWSAVQSSSVTGSPNHPADPEWEYGLGDHGVKHWSEFEPRCNGTHQSPINLHEARYNASLLHMHFEGYHDGEEFNFTLLNNGHSAVLTLPRQFYMIGGGLKGRYVANSLHFHWGKRNSRGSEHSIHGRTFPMEMHIVHYSEDYSNMEDVIANGTSDAITVAGFLFELSTKDNEYLDSLIKNLRHVREPDHSYSILGFPLDSLLPCHHHFYYRYEGSLTTPDCVEKVMWNMFSDRIQISTHQLAQFRLLKDHRGQGLFDNVRPEQPLNDRLIYTNIQHDNFDVSEVTSSGLSLHLHHLTILFVCFIGTTKYVF